MDVELDQQIVEKILAFGGPGRRMRLRPSLPPPTGRCAAFTTWLHTYNHHRGHTALGGQSPASRVPNLSGQYQHLANGSGILNP